MKCKNCGRDYQEGINYCPYCGAEYTSDNTPSKKNILKVITQGKIIASYGILVGLLAFTIIALFAKYRASGTNEQFSLSMLKQMLERLKIIKPVPMLYYLLIGTSGLTCLLSVGNIIVNKDSKIIPMALLTGIHVTLLIGSLHVINFLKVVCSFKLDKIFDGSYITPDLINGYADIMQSPDKVLGDLRIAIFFSFVVFLYAIFLLIVNLRQPQQEYSHLTLQSFKVSKPSQPIVDETQPYVPYKEKNNGL